MRQINNCLYCFLNSPDGFHLIKVQMPVTIIFRINLATAITSVLKMTRLQSLMENKYVKFSIPTKSEYSRTSDCNPQCNDNSEHWNNIKEEQPDHSIRIIIVQIVLEFLVFRTPFL